MKVLMFVKKHLLFLLLICGQCFGLTQTVEKVAEQSVSLSQQQTQQDLSNLLNLLNAKVDLLLKAFVKKADFETTKRILCGSTHNVEFFKIIGLIALESVLFGGALGAASANHFTAKSIKDNMYQDMNNYRFTGLIVGICLAYACCGGEKPKLKARDVLIPSLIALYAVASASVAGGNLGWLKESTWKIPDSVKPYEFWSYNAACFSALCVAIYFVIKRRKLQKAPVFNHSADLLTELKKSFTRTRLRNFKENHMSELIELAKKDKESKSFLKIAPVIAGILLIMCLPEIVKNMPITGRSDRSECPICLSDTLENVSKDSDDEHTFLKGTSCQCRSWCHRTCLESWYATFSGKTTPATCPTCRAPYALENITKVD